MIYNMARWETNSVEIPQHKAMEVAHILELAATKGEGYPLATQRRLNRGEVILLELSRKAIARNPSELTLKTAEEIAARNRSHQ